MKAVILAGGHGTRLYPLSTKEHPKQFINLIGERTLFQQTIDRLNFLKPEDIFVATNKEYVHFIKEQSPEIPDENIFIEPAMRNTATCIGFAAMQLSKLVGQPANTSRSTPADKPDLANRPTTPAPVGQSAHEVMAIIYADHLVRDTEEFANKLRTAEKLAKEENTLNIIEVEAKFPNTKLGYVQTGKLLREIDGNKIYEFKKFKEKPDEETAKSYLNSGDYLWNTGFYVWQIETILEKFKKHLPDTYSRLIKMRDDPESIQHEYEKCENISIDYAIMEKVDPSEVRIIPAILGWSDIGTWESLLEELGNNAKNGDSAEIEKLERFKEIYKSASSAKG